MNYSIYKFEFSTGVHFGNGMLNDTSYTFPADSLFSAMYIEAIKLGCQDAFYNSVFSGELLISDMLPYVKDTYMLPKPMLYIEPANRGNSEEKKKYKKLKYIPVDQMKDYLKGKMDLNQDYMEGFVKNSRQIMAAVRQDDETLPYHVGVCYYGEHCGLYVIVCWEKEEHLLLAEVIFDSLGYTGIGGKKSSGMGKFVAKKGKMSDALLKLLKNELADRYLLLSTALPKEMELEDTLEEASYQLLKRSGFVASDQYAEEQVKKKDLYVFSAGSCFKHRFDGDIYNVSKGGSHPVYRYAKPVFMGV